MTDGSASNSNKPWLRLDMKHWHCARPSAYAMAMAIGNFHIRLCYVNHIVYIYIIVYIIVSVYLSIYYTSSEALPNLIQPMH